MKIIFLQHPALFGYYIESRNEPQVNMEKAMVVMEERDTDKSPSEFIKQAAGHAKEKKMEHLIILFSGDSFLYDLLEENMKDDAPLDDFKHCMYVVMLKEITGYGGEDSLQGFDSFFKKKYGLRKVSILRKKHFIVPLIIKQWMAECKPVINEQRTMEEPKIFRRINAYGLISYINTFFNIPLDVKNMNIYVDVDNTAKLDAFKGIKRIKQLNIYLEDLAYNVKALDKITDFLSTARTEVQNCTIYIQNGKNAYDTLIKKSENLLNILKERSGNSLWADTENDAGGRFRLSEYFFEIKELSNGEKWHKEIENVTIRDSRLSVEMKRIEKTVSDIKSDEYFSCLHAKLQELL